MNLLLNTMSVYKGSQRVSLSFDPGDETSKSRNCNNKEEYFMLTHSVTSPPVSVQQWTEAPGSSTLPSAGRDREREREHLYSNYINLMSLVSGC